MIMKNQKGASAIEFAIILPLLVVLVFGIIEFSILLYDKAMITNASREGARAGIVFRPDSPLSDAEITNIVNNYCAAHLITFGSASPVTTIKRVNDAPGDPLTVTVSYQYDFLVIPNLINTITGAINLNATTVMRME